MEISPFDINPKFASKIYWKWGKPAVDIDIKNNIKTNIDRSKAVLLLWFLTVTCSCWPYLYFGSAIMLVTYFSKFWVAEWSPACERAVHSVYRECLS